MAELNQPFLFFDLAFTELNKSIKKLEESGASEESIKAHIKFKNNKIREAVRKSNARTYRRD